MLPSSPGNVKNNSASYANQGRVTPLAGALRSPLPLGEGARGRPGNRRAPWEFTLEKHEPEKAGSAAKAAKSADAVLCVAVSFWFFVKFFLATFREKDRKIAHDRA
jgi:hypothetical protein